MESYLKFGIGNQFKYHYFYQKVFRLLQVRFDGNIWSRMMKDDTLTTHGCHQGGHILDSIMLRGIITFEPFLYPKTQRYFHSCCIDLIVTLISRQIVILPTARSYQSLALKRVPVLSPQAPCGDIRPSVKPSPFIYL